MVTLGLLTSQLTKVACQMQMRKVQRACTPVMPANAFELTAFTPSLPSSVGLEQVDNGCMALISSPLQRRPTTLSWVHAQQTQCHYQGQVGWPGERSVSVCSIPDNMPFFILCCNSSWALRKTITRGSWFAAPPKAILTASIEQTSKDLTQPSPNCIQHSALSTMEVTLCKQAHT